jgi:hypothetical protein
MCFISCVSTVCKYNVCFSFVHICVMVSKMVFFMTEHYANDESVGEK